MDVRVLLSLGFMVIASVGATYAACGGAPTFVGELRDSSPTDVASSSIDAAFEGEVESCADGGYFITINGDGTEQVFQSNGWEPRFADAQPVPLARLQACGEGCLRKAVWAARTPDGGGSVRLTPAPWTVLQYEASGRLYTSWATDAQADVVVERWDEAGGVAMGSYSAVVARDAPDRGVLSLWGRFCAFRAMDDAPPP